MDIKTQKILEATVEIVTSIISGVDEDACIDMIDEPEHITNLIEAIFKNLTSLTY